MRITPSRGGDAKFHSRANAELCGLAAGQHQRPMIRCGLNDMGNQPLDAVSPGLVVVGPNFLHVAGSGTPADCTSSFAQAPGTTCNLSISFQPTTGGALTSTATFTDNALNTSPSVSQAIALQGTGIMTANAADGH